MDFTESGRGFTVVTHAIALTVIEVGLWQCQTRITLVKVTTKNRRRVREITCNPMILRISVLRPLFFKCVRLQPMYK